MVEGEAGARGFLCPGTTIVGFSAANRSRAAIQFFRLSGVVSPTYMRHWLYTTSPATIRPIDGTCRDVVSGLSVWPCSEYSHRSPSALWMFFISVRCGLILL